MSDFRALEILTNSPVSQEMIQKLVAATLQVLPCQEKSSSPKSKAYPSPPSSPGSEKQLPSLMKFITKLVTYTNVYTGTLMATLVYLNRLKSKLPKNAQGLTCTRHRIFLSCLILSAKFHNDSSPKNCHWKNYTDGLFDLKDINLMERQLLYLLDWDLKVSNEEMYQHLSCFLEPIKNDLKKASHIKKQLHRQKKQQQEQIIRQQQLDFLIHKQKLKQEAKSPLYQNPSHFRASSTSSECSSNSSNSSSYPSPDLQAKLNNYVTLTLPSSNSSSNLKESLVNKKFHDFLNSDDMDPLTKYNDSTDTIDTVIKRYTQHCVGY